MIWLVLGCQEIRSMLVSNYPMNYDVPVAEAKNNLGKDLLVPAKQSKAQITDMVFFDDDQFLMVLHKKGELVVYEYKEGIIGKNVYETELDVRSSAEQGLLGIAFHPQYQDNHLIYLHLTPKEGNDRTEIGEYEYKNNGNTFSLQKKRILLEVDQPYGNHNGGHMEFGFDGYLYIGLGDGGWRDDPHQHGQNTKTLLGTILRIDVQKHISLPDREYQIPPDNPFADSPIFLYGIRNPWKFSILPNGSVIVADVGQNAYEEVHVARSGDNLGWNIQEGRHCFQNPSCDSSALNQPVWEYDHSIGQSITGGVYTKTYKKNWYFVGDFTAGHIWKLPLDEMQKTTSPNVSATLLGTFSILPSTFAITKQDIVYVSDFGSGMIYEIRDTTIQ